MPGGIAAVKKAARQQNKGRRHRTRHRIGLTGWKRLRKYSENLLIPLSSIFLLTREKALFILLER